MNFYLIVRQVQIWVVLVPCVLFVIGYAATEFRKKDFASWYIMGWGVTCVFAFTLSVLRFQFPSAEWTRIAGIILGFMIMFMAWWMLGVLIWVWCKRYKERKQEANDNTAHDSK